MCSAILRSFQRPKWRFPAHTHHIQIASAAHILSVDAGTYIVKLWAGWVGIILVWVNLRVRGRYFRAISMHNNNMKRANIVLEPYQQTATRHSRRVLGFVGQALIRAIIEFCFVVRQYFGILNLEIACLGVVIFSNNVSFRVCAYRHNGFSVDSAHNTL